jgi:predicted RNA methylase
VCNAESLAQLDDDASAVVAAAHADQVLHLSSASGESAILAATGACCAGSGGLAWAATQPNAVVRAKYRMMAAMLKDGARNACFAAAIERRVRAHQERTGTPPLVLDIGTGSGFLGMVAARAGARVLACEMNEAMADVARRVVAHNGLADRMEVRAVRSDGLTVADLGGSRADLIVSETLDSELLSEGVLPTLRHAQRELLARGGAVVPHRARVFAEARRAAAQTPGRADAHYCSRLPAPRVGTARARRRRGRAEPAPA